MSPKHEFKQPKALLGLHFKTIPYEPTKLSLFRDLSCNDFLFHGLEPTNHVAFKNPNQGPFFAKKKSSPTSQFRRARDPTDAQKYARSDNKGRAENGKNYTPLF